MQFQSRLSMFAVAGLVLATFCIAALPIIVDANTGHVRAVDAWIPAAPPGARMLAGYVELVNEGADPVTITSVRAAGFEIAEIHQSFNDNGLARMRRVEAIEIPAGESVELSQGGLHIMLMRPERVPEPGESVTIELLDGNDTTVVTFDADVRPR